MEPAPGELAQEQRYFDVAYDHRQQHQSALSQAPAAAANPGAAKRLLAWTKRKGAPPPVEAVAFARTDNETGDSYYIGRSLITDDHHEVLVVSWQSPAAVPYYTATHDDPKGLVRKRSYECQGNTIVDFQDLVMRQLLADIAALADPVTVDPQPIAADRVPPRPFDPKIFQPPAVEPPPVAVPPVQVPVEGAETAAVRLGPDVALLAELDGSRTGQLRDIVATIHASQYELIRSPLEQLLVIEGGPGTGKTVVALHRVSYLLYHHRGRLPADQVLVVGPNPAFTRYISTVLPGLGDGEVVRRDLGQFAPAVRRGLTESSAVRRLKGEVRMAGLIARALEARIGTPEPAERMSFDGQYVTLSGVEVSTAVNTAREAGGPYAQRRQMLRTRLTDLARARGAPPGRLAPIDNLVERLWPQYTAAAFLRNLFASRPRLTAAAGPEFTVEDIELLHRRGADRLSEQIWSAADLALLDEAESLLNGTPDRFGHIVVDEAQDLSPMQLRAIARRSATGSMTVVGDLAQSTGVWARDSWDDVTAHLPSTQPLAVATLRYGYRVPRRVYDVAARLLPIVAPGAAPLRVVRDGPADPVVHQVDPASRAGRAVAVASAHAARNRYVGIVCPAGCRTDVEAALNDNGVPWSAAEGTGAGVLVNLVSPQEAKGLEFDAVVVVEPEQIVAGDERGHRMLFVALTRTTRYLDIVCVGEPVPVGTPSAAPVPSPRPPVEPGFSAEQAERLAEEIAAIVSGSAPVRAWNEVLTRAAELLERQGGRTNASGRHRRG
jgi:DNA helicase IV